MKIDRVEVAHGVGVAFYLNFDDGEGMRSVLNLANAIEDGSALAGPATVATPRRVMTLRPAECARGEQNCDDCPELRCGDQLWPVLRDERFSAIADPAASDQARFDALLSLCYQLRSRNDELVAEVAESVDLRANAVAQLEKLRSSTTPDEVRLVRLRDEAERLRRSISEKEARLAEAGRTLADATARASTWEARARELGWEGGDRG